MTVGRIGIVMVTYNSEGVLRGCLSALDGGDFEVVVVDNASSDSTCELVSRCFPDVTLLRNDTNVGFARAVNHGVSVLSSDLIMLLNPDAVIRPDAVVALAQAVDAQPDHIGAPLIRDPTGTTRIVGGGKFPTPGAMFLHYSGLSRLATVLPPLSGHYLTRRQIVTGDDVVLVEWVSGACIMLTRTLWEALGGLSERWFMYAEDIELCWRAALLGGGRAARTCFIDTRVDSTHLVGSSSTKSRGRVVDSPLRQSDWVRNLYDFYCSSMARSRVDCVLWGCATAAGLSVRGVLFFVQGVRPGRNGTRFRQNGVAFMRHAAAVVACAPSANVTGVR